MTLQLRNKIYPMFFRKLLLPINHLYLYASRSRFTNFLVREIKIRGSSNSINVQAGYPRQSFNFSYTFSCRWIQLSNKEKLSINTFLSANKAKAKRKDSEMFLKNCWNNMEFIGGNLFHNNWYLILARTQIFLLKKLENKLTYCGASLADRKHSFTKGKTTEANSASWEEYRWSAPSIICNLWLGMIFEKASASSTGMISSLEPWTVRTLHFS